MTAIRTKRKLLTLNEHEVCALATLRKFDPAHIQYIEDGVIYLEDLESDKPVKMATSSFNRLRVNNLISHDSDMEAVQIWRITSKGLSVINKLQPQI